MSSRSFRDRYTSTQREQPPQADTPERTLGDAWPLPEGARIERALVGHCAVHDALYSGEEVARAAELLGRLADHGGVDLARMRFLDTETTGLAGGTGTHVFLVGVGRFVGSTFHVRQLFMRHPGEERALLHHTEAALADDATLVTFNGRTFDMPLLETRYRMHRRASPPVAEHLDLLHPARRIWKHRLPSCSLGTLEREVLGVTRQRDAPGWLIPQLYFEFLRSRNVEPLEAVFSHNRMDVLSLARLTALVLGWSAGLEEPVHPADRLANAIVRLSNGDLSDPQVANLLEAATDPRTPALLRMRAYDECTRILRRAGRAESLLPMWQAGLRDPSRMVRQFSQEELGKHLEHRARDLAAARVLIAQAYDHASQVGDITAAAAFERRLLRIERKLASAAASASSRAGAGVRVSHEPLRDREPDENPEAYA